jgi:hypothetical protein
MGRSVLQPYKIVAEIEGESQDAVVEILRSLGMTNFQN